MLKDAAHVVRVRPGRRRSEAEARDVDISFEGKFHTNTLTATVSFTAVPQRTTAIKDSRNETHAGGELTRNRVFTSRQVKSSQVKSSQVKVQVKSSQDVPRRHLLTVEKVVPGVHTTYTAYSRLRGIRFLA